MDWEKKFTTIVHETEANLERVRRRLEAARNGAEVVVVPTASVLLSKPVVGSSLSSVIPSPKPSDAASHIRQSTIMENYNTDQSQPPIWATILEEKIVNQKRVIDTLTETVISLQNEKEKQKSSIESLRDIVAALQERLEKRGVDLGTEEKFNHWKQETSHEINSLKQQVKQQNVNFNGSQTFSSGNLPVIQTSAIEELKSQIHTAKTSCREEVESARKDVDYYKTRMTRLERNITALGDDLSSLSHKHNELKSDVTTLKERSRLDYRELTNTISEKLTDMNVARNEISELKADLADKPPTRSSPNPSPLTAVRRHTTGGNKWSKARQPTQWRELLSHSLSTLSVDSNDSSLSSGYLARKRSKESNASETVFRPLAGGVADSSSDEEDVRSDVTLSSPSSSPTSLSINDL